MILLQKKATNRPLWLINDIDTIGKLIPRIPSFFANPKLRAAAVQLLRTYLLYLENGNSKNDYSSDGIEAISSQWSSFEQVLMQAFPKGFQKESGLDLKKLRKRWLETYKEELTESDDEVRQLIQAHCIDTGKRWYLPDLLLTDSDREKVLN